MFCKSLKGKCQFKLPKKELCFNLILQPGPCFWFVFFIGLAIRIYFVFFTQGTYDVAIWQQHASGVAKMGLIGYYHANIEMNHPPFIAVCMSLLWRFAQTSGIDFHILLRAPFVILDIGTTFLILTILQQNRHRLLITACYWLYPLAMIFSAYHGNTDSSLPFFIMLSVYLLSKEKVVWAGAILGISLWIKLPPILIIPAFLFSLPYWKWRMKFLLTVGLVGASTYVIPLLYDYGIIYKNVFAYHGQLIQTTSGIPVWGMRIFLLNIQQLPLEWQRLLYRPVIFFLQHNTGICIFLILLFSLMRRGKRTSKELVLTVVGIYTILYGFSIYWSFQYFAWSIPLWFLVPMWFSVPATTLAALYIYGLYWLLCGNPWLFGEWDFIGHPYWPEGLILLRDIALLFFFLSAVVFLAKGIVAEIVQYYHRALDKPACQKTDT